MANEQVGICVINPSYLRYLFIYIYNIHTVFYGLLMYIASVKYIQSSDFSGTTIIMIYTINREEEEYLYTHPIPAEDEGKYGLLVLPKRH